MAEYMDYNDVDYGYKTERKRIFANIRLVIAIVFILVVVIWTWTHLPENVRTSFKSVYSSEHKIGDDKKDDKNEFVSFNKKYKNDETIAFDEEFLKKYPEISKLVRMTKLEITKQKVNTFDLGGYFVIAQTYEVNREKDSNGEYYDANNEYIIGTTGVDFYIFKYSTDKNFSISKPERFSIRLHAGQKDTVPYIEKAYVKGESFRLNFYSLSVVVKSDNEFSEVYTNISLENGITRKEDENNYFIKQSFIKSSENKDLIGVSERINGGEMGDLKIDSRFELNTPMKQAEIGLNFEDEIYNKFLSFSISPINNATYTIKVN